MAWLARIQARALAGSQVENVRVVASHLGIGFHPAAWWVVADRLAQRSSDWQPFRRPEHGVLRALAFPKPLA